MADQDINNNNNNSNHHDELDPELQSAMASTNIANGNTTVNGNSTSNNGTDYSHPPSHQHDHPPTSTPSLLEITHAVMDIHTILGRRYEEDLNTQPVRLQILGRLRRMHAEYEELADRFGELSYAAGEPNPEGSQSAVTTTTTATTSSTTVNGDTSANGNSTNNCYDAYTKTVPEVVSSLPPAVLSSSPSTVVSSLPSLRVPTPATAQEQPHVQGFFWATILDLISTIRRQVSRLRDGFRALERYLGEDITQPDSLQIVEMLRQALALFLEVSSITLRELDELEMTARR